eukprot:scaffold23.g4151.t1
MLINNPIIWIPMEREWELGTQLRVALQEPDGSLPGFMAVEDCLVKQQGEQRVRFAGFTMEKLNGWEVYKRIDTPEFHNIHYASPPDMASPTRTQPIHTVREMLFQVFSALDVAQRKLGFHHADLGGCHPETAAALRDAAMRNVMEHYPELWEEVEEEQRAKNVAAKEAGVRPAHVPHSRTGSHYETSPGALPSDAERSTTGSPRALPLAVPPAAPMLDSTIAPPQGPGQRVEVQRMPTEPMDSSPPPRGALPPARPRNGAPLGPRLQFKIIDYGIAAFNETLAQAAGGSEYKQVMARVNEVFSARCITYQQPPPSKQTIRMATSEEAVPGMAPPKEWHLLHTGEASNRYLVKQTPEGAFPVVGGSGLTSPVTSGMLDSIQREGGVEVQVNPQVSQKNKDGSAAEGPMPPAPSMSPIERAYRRFCSPAPIAAPLFRRHKGDVFHLLVGLAVSLDDSTAHQGEQQADAIALAAAHAGVRMRASFARETEQTQQVFGKLSRLASKGLTHAMNVWQLGCGEKEAAPQRQRQEQQEELGRRERWGAWWRRMSIRLRAHLHPYNSGLTAGEALVTPFFKQGQWTCLRLVLSGGWKAQAHPPVCVDVAFPRCPG